MLASTDCSFMATLERFLVTPAVIIRELLRQTRGAGLLGDAVATLLPVPRAAD